jgi:hypothetical protein
VNDASSILSRCTIITDYVATDLYKLARELIASRPKSMGGRLDDIETRLIQHAETLLALSEQARNASGIPRKA